MTMGGSVPEEVSDVGRGSKERREMCSTDTGREWRVLEDP